MSARIGRTRAGRFLLAAGAVVLLAAGSTVAIAAVSGALSAHAQPYAAQRLDCAAPAPSGTGVTVRLTDMRTMMDAPGGMMGGRTPGYDGPVRQQYRPTFGRGMMSILTSRTAVPAGEVSLTVINTGRLTHELVVLPLAPGARPGSRPAGADGAVDETGSVGEASATCAAGPGHGIAAGSAGWVSLRLPAGRYELICNLPGHYAAGMYTELDVG